MPTNTRTAEATAENNEIKAFVKWLHRPATKQLRSLQQKITEFTAISGQRVLVMIMLPPDANAEGTEEKVLGSFTSACWTVFQQVAPKFSRVTRILVANRNDVENLPTWHHKRLLCFVSPRAGAAVEGAGHL